VDDSVDTCEMLSALLGQLGYEVLTRHTCADALSAAPADAADLYVLDTRLTDCSGYDLCRRLCAAAPGKPLVFYTGAAAAGARAEGLAAGACAYVVKPTVDELVATVTHLLPARRNGAT
jgi:DNA-binding response OmpR family regulator